VELSRSLANLYGDLYLNPPSTPILLVDRSGVVHTLAFGIKSAEELLSFVEPLLEEGA
jgi:hypothetical protein